MMRTRRGSTALALFVAIVAVVGPGSARGQAGDRATEAARKQSEADAARKARLIEAIRQIPAADDAPRRREVAQPPQGFAIRYEDPEERDDRDDPPGGPPSRVLAKDNLDRWIFGETDDESIRHERLETMLVQKIERAARFNRLTPAQQARLRIAGNGDLKRFFDRVEEKRAEFENVRRDRRSGVRLLTELYPEQSDYRQGPFGRGSLYDKMLNKILAEDPGRQTPMPTILDR